MLIACFDLPGPIRTRRKMTAEPKEKPPILDTLGAPIRFEQISTVTNAAMTKS